MGIMSYPWSHTEANAINDVYCVELLRKSSTYHKKFACGFPRRPPCLKSFLAFAGSIFILLLSLFCNPSHAASLSLEMGHQSTSVAMGRDFGFGYGMLGLSARFTTDAPWSYVSTSEDLNESCSTFQSEPTKACNPKGFFHDGDEWELFGKVGYRLPLVSMLYLNTGVGISRQKSALLYLFCVGIDDPTRGCSSARLFETWGQVEHDYFMTFIGGLSLEMTRRILLHVDYHSRRGLMSGLMWRF